MFFIKRLNHKVKLQPSFFGPNLRDQVIAQLIHEFEGKYFEDYFVIAVRDPGRDEISTGKTIPGTGCAEFNVDFTAVVFRVFKGQVVEGQVSTISKLGFFVDVGPMRVFVSKRVLPPCYSLATGERVDQTGSGIEEIGKGDVIRVRIIGIRFDYHNGLVGTGEFGDFLGPL